MVLIERENIYGFNKYHKDCKRWKVFWHVTLSGGNVDKGSKSLKLKTDALKFKEYGEKEATFNLLI